MKLVPNHTRRPSVSDNRQQRADRRPQQRIDAAGDGGEHDLQRHRDARHRLGIEIHHVLPVDRAAERGQRRADDGHAQLLAQHVDADRGGGILVLGNRLERLAADAAVDQPPDAEPGQPQHERDAVEIALLGKLQRVPGMADGLRREAERAAGDVARGNERQQHDLAERERHQREIVADDLAGGSTDSR